jgi:hypothetical protein
MEQLEFVWINKDVAVVRTDESAYETVAGEDFQPLNTELCGGILDRFKIVNHSQLAPQNAMF